MNTATAKDCSRFESMGHAGKDECEWCDEFVDEDDLTDVEDEFVWCKGHDGQDVYSPTRITWRLCPTCVAEDVLAS